MQLNKTLRSSNVQNPRSLLLLPQSRLNCEISRFGVTALLMLTDFLAYLQFAAVVQVDTK